MFAFMFRLILYFAVGISAGASLEYGQCPQLLGECSEHADGESELSLLQMSASTKWRSLPMGKLLVPDPTRAKESACAGAALRACNVTKVTLQSKDHILLLHIGKTGGSSIRKSLRHHLNTSRAWFADRAGHAGSYRELHECAEHRDHKFAYFVRAPVHRYVSGWISRFRMGGTHMWSRWSMDEFLAFARFHSPDELGCALSSSNPGRRIAAHHAMHAIEHVRSSLADYWGGKENLEKCGGSTFFVGRTEHLDEDYARLVKTLGSVGALHNSAIADGVELVHEHKTPSKYAGFQHLGSCAIQNLRQWYKRDYELIGILTEQGFLPDGYPLEIDTIDMQHEPSFAINVFNYLTFRTTWLLATFVSCACLCFNVFFLGLVKAFLLRRRHGLDSDSHANHVYSHCVSFCCSVSIAMVALLFVFALLALVCD